MSANDPAKLLMSSRDKRTDSYRKLSVLARFHEMKMTPLLDELIEEEWQKVYNQNKDSKLFKALITTEGLDNEKPE